MTASQEIQDSFEESLNLNCEGKTAWSLKRHSQNGSTSICDNSSGLKRFCNGIVSTVPPEGEASPLLKFTGFLTAGSKSEIKVSEAALNLARACLNAQSDTVSEEEQSLNGDVSAADAAPSFSGFITAGSKKVIAVTEASLLAAKRRLDAIPDTDPKIPRRIPNEENLDPSRGPLLRTNPTSKRGVELCGTPVTTRNSRNRFNSPFRPHDMVKPIPSVGASANIAAGVTPAVFTTPSRITCIRDLRNCKSSSVDFLGIVIEGGHSGEQTSAGIPTIKLADRYGESVSVELLSSSIPPNIARGSVISVEGALVKRSQATISLVLNDSAFVDLEPSDPEADCLHRLFSTGLFDVAAKDPFSFDDTSLRMIARLGEYPGETSTIMARISSINLDTLVYLGCTNCKLLVNPNPKGVVSCQHCSNSKARYFYSLNAELADFSGVIAVTLSDDTAEKLIGRPAGAMVKLTKEVLRTRLSTLYFRPMLFRTSLQNSKWLVDEWKPLDIPKFKPYLKNIAAQKGYK